MRQRHDSDDSHGGKAALSPSWGNMEPAHDFLSMVECEHLVAIMPFMDTFSYLVNDTLKDMFKGLTVSPAPRKWSLSTPLSLPLPHLGLTPSEAGPPSCELREKLGSKEPN